VVTPPASPHTAVCLLARCHCQVKAILQQLPGVNPNPTIGLAEAAQLLRTNLNVSLVR
jgi:hypothetical protein